jgi:hypothetical protein
MKAHQGGEVVVARWNIRAALVDHQMATVNYNPTDHIYTKCKFKLLYMIQKLTSRLFEAILSSSVGAIAFALFIRNVEYTIYPSCALANACH